MVFNPQANYDREPQFLQYSRGFRDNSAATLVGGITETLDTKIKATDRAYAQLAQDEVRNAVNAVDSDQLGIENYTPPKDPMENEVRGQVRNLEVKKRAMEAGSLSPSHYYSTLSAKTKEIRARYSGYNDVIDSELKSLGIDPNWQRDQMMSAARAAQEAGARKEAEIEKNNREFVEAAIKSVPMSPELRAVAIQPGAHLDPKFMAVMKLKTNEYASIKGDLDLRKSEIDTLDAGDKLKARKTTELYGKELNTLVYTSAVQSGAWKGFQNSMERVQKEIATGGVASPESNQKLLSDLQMVRGMLNNERLKVRAKIGGENLALDPDGIKKQDELFDSVLDQLQKAVSTKDVALLGATMFYIENKVKSKQADMMNSKEEFTNLMATREILGENAWAVVVQESEEIRDAVASYNNLDRQARIIQDQVPSFNAEMKTMIAKGEANPIKLRKMFDTSLKLIEATDIKDEGKVKHIKFMFAPENQEFFDTLMKDNGLSIQEKRQYFQRMTSPTVRKEVFRMSDNYDPSLSRRYSDMVNYMSYRMNRESAADVNDIVVNSSIIDISYNTKTQQLEINAGRNVDTGNPARNFALGVLEYFTPSTAAEAVKNINASLDAMRPIWEKDKVDPAVAGLRFIERLGIDTSAFKEGNLIEQLDRKINPRVPDVTGGGGADKLGGDSANDTLRQAEGRTQTPDSSVPVLSAERATEIADMLTGIPSFMEAVQSGDPKAIAGAAALAMATIIPFPGAKAGTKAIVEGGGTLIDAVTLEARRAAKGLENFDVEKQIKNPFDILKEFGVTPKGLSYADSVQENLKQRGLDMASTSNTMLKDVDSLIDRAEKAGIKASDIRETKLVKKAIESYSNELERAQKTLDYLNESPNNPTLKKGLEGHLDRLNDWEKMIDNAFDKTQELREKLKPKKVK